MSSSKTETQEYRELLDLTLFAFNNLQNQKINDGEGTDTYSIAKAIVETFTKWDKIVPENYQGEIVSKAIKDYEMLEIIDEAVTSDTIRDVGDYNRFLKDLGELIAAHFGGKVQAVRIDTEGDIGYKVVFEINDSVPSNGGVYKRYDTSVIWKDGKEVKDENKYNQADVFDPHN